VLHTVCYWLGEVKTLVREYGAVQIRLKE